LGKYITNYIQRDGEDGGGRHWGVIHNELQKINCAKTLILNYYYYLKSIDFFFFCFFCCFDLI